MRQPSFPRRDGDGTFVVRILFAVSGADDRLPALVRDYLSAWIAANRTWTRIWRSDVIEVEQLVFERDFQQDPTLERSEDGSVLSVVLRGRAEALRWKDWAVRLVEELVSVFRELKFERFDSRPPGMTGASSTRR